MTEMQPPTSEALLGHYLTPVVHLFILADAIGIEALLLGAGIRTITRGFRRGKGSH